MYWLLAIMAYGFPIYLGSLHMFSEVGDTHPQKIAVTEQLTQWVLIASFLLCLSLDCPKTEQLLLRFE